MSSASGPRSSAPGGSPAPARMPSTAAVEQEPGHRQRVGRLHARPRRPPAASCRRLHERRQRPLRRGDDGQAARGSRAHARAPGWRRRRRRPGRPRVGGQARIGRRDASQEQVDGGLVVDGRRQGDRAQEAPRAGDPADERGPGRRGAAVDGEERSRVAGHRAMLPRPRRRPGSRVPGRPRRRAPRAGRSAARCRPRRRGSRSPARTRRRTSRAAPDRRRASRWRRAAGTAGSPRGNAPPGRSARAAGSRGRPARRARRGCSSVGSRGVVMRLRWRRAGRWTGQPRRRRRRHGRGGRRSRARW